MIRTFTIKETPNDKGFERYWITQDNGRPYLENPPVIGTNDPVELFRALAEFLEEMNREDA